MKELIRQRLVLKIRNGEKFGEYVNELLKKYGPTLDFSELEIYQDFEDLYSLLQREMENFYASRQGYIYVARYGATGHVKVGKTTLPPSLRERALNNESAMEDIEFIHAFHVFDCSAVEMEIHQALKKKFPKKKEYFFGNENTICSDVEKIIMDCEVKYFTSFQKIGLQIQHVGVSTGL